MTVFRGTGEGFTRGLDLPKRDKGGPLALQ
jgi:hypothetical protein